MAGAPIEITLYEKGPDPGDGQVFTKKIVSWGLLKRALRLGEELDADEVKENAPPDNSWAARFHRWVHRNDPVLTSGQQIMDRISEFVVDVFDGQFTAKQLEDGADAGEIMTVLYAVIARAQGMGSGFPTVPPKKTNPPPKPPRKRHP